jgi:hypothetical protein
MKHSDPVLILKKVKLLRRGEVKLVEVLPKANLPLLKRR